jgi:hypothetical protein
MEKRVEFPPVSDWGWEIARVYFPERGSKSMKHVPLRHFIVACVLVVSLVAPAQKRAVELKAGQPGGSLLKPDTLTTVFPLLNRTGENFERVQVTAISIENGSLAEPEKLPIDLGAIPTGHTAGVFAIFTGRFTAKQTYSMKLAGSYLQAGEKQTFAVEGTLRIPAAPGSEKTTAVSLAPNAVASVTQSLENPASPELDDEGMAPGIPTGSLHRSEPPGPPTALIPAPPAGVDPKDLEIFRHCVVANSSGPIQGGSTNEPSGAVSDSGDEGNTGCGKGGMKKGRTLFATANTFAALSTDDGATFSKLNFSAIPGFTGSICCDQVVVFVPKINRFVWTMLMRNIPGQTGRVTVRLMAASPEDLRKSGGQTGWTIWEFTPAILDLKGPGSFDFPGLAVGDNSLYLNFDGFGGFIVCRIPLNEITAGGTLHLRFTHPEDSPLAELGHVTENPGDEVFWAQHNRNSELRVFSWPENSDDFQSRDIEIASWPNDPSKLTSKTPDGHDWQAATSPGRIRGAARFKSAETDEVWFAWTASKGDSFKQPHVRWVKLDPKHSLKILKQGNIFNDHFAFGYPALAANSHGELGMSLEAGGGSFENHVVGFQGDDALHRTSNSSVGLDRFGDYVTIHRDLKNGTRLDAFGYGMEGTPATATTHFVMFGRGQSQQ